MAAVGRLVCAHLDFDGNGRLAFLADLDLLVVTFDAGAMRIGLVDVRYWDSWRGELTLCRG